MASNTTEDINKSMSDKVSDPASIPSKVKAMSEAGINLDEIYLQADSFIGNPYALLGAVLEVRKTPDNPQGKIKLSKSMITGAKVDESSKIKEPIKRGSIVVDQKLSLGVGFLNYLSTQFEANTTFSLMVFDQMAGLVDRRDESWDNGMDKWIARNKELLDNPDVLAVYAVIGFVQKYIIRKTFKKFQIDAKGGAMGLNINGELYTGNEDFSLDIHYGLQTVVIKEQAVTEKGHTGLGFSPERAGSEPSVMGVNLVHDVAMAEKFKISAAELV